MAMLKLTKSAREKREAERAARAQKPIMNLPPEVRLDLGHPGAKARMRGNVPGHALENQTRHDLYELARQRGIRGRSRMGKWDLVEALRGQG